MRSSPNPANSCAAGQPAALSAEAGISVGWGDEHQPYKEGQYVDLTHLPAGEYRLVNQVNPQRLLMESRYNNGVAGVTIRLSWPHGQGRLPAAKILGSCSGQAACAWGRTLGSDGTAGADHARAIMALHARYPR